MSAPRTYRGRQTPEPVEVRTGSALKTIHIFCKFKNPYGGAEAEALQLFELLREKRDVRLWALSTRASPALLDQYPIKRVSSAQLALPDGGTYIFVCHHWRKGVWRFLAHKPERLIYIYNIFHPSITAHTSKSPPRWPPVEYVFVSDFQRRILNLDGEVHVSPIDIQKFVPTTRAPGDRLVIGRLSRDTPDKFHADDFPVFADLVRGGCTVRLQGGTCLEQQLNGSGVELLPAGHHPAQRFLQDLDIFYFRSGAHVETFGRVVFEAMACGLPVVCHSHGGYADWIRHGENGYLFDTSNEARDILARLVADASLRRRIGLNARKTVEDMYSEQAQEQRLAFYLR
jgi:glycosyltransferase involved in cell wall biosynthesis